ncbi:hypothetical protein D9M71_719110 [compost metagenome]
MSSAIISFGISSYIHCCKPFSVFKISHPHPKVAYMATTPIPVKKVNGVNQSSDPPEKIPLVVLMP